MAHNDSSGSFLSNKPREARLSPTHARDIVNAHDREGRGDIRDFSLSSFYHPSFCTSPPYRIPAPTRNPSATSSSTPPLCRPRTTSSRRSCRKPASERTTSSTIWAPATGASSSRPPGRRAAAPWALRSTPISSTTAKSRCAGGSPEPRPLHRGRYLHGRFQRRHRGDNLHGGHVNLKLRPKLIRELKPGTRIASYCFDMGDWKPDSVSSFGKEDAYFWIIPQTPRGSGT